MECTPINGNMRQKAWRMQGSRARDGEDQARVTDLKGKEVSDGGQYFAIRRE
jgi:hypothetical protein